LSQILKNLKESEFINEQKFLGICLVLKKNISEGILIKFLATKNFSGQFFFWKKIILKFLQ